MKLPKIRLVSVKAEGISGGTVIVTVGAMQFALTLSWSRGAQ